jgi:molybdate transport system regulatory protein
MSYRLAWGLLDDLNHSLAEPVAAASVGGTGGGGAALTDYGRELVRSYRAVERIAAKAAEERFTAARSGPSRQITRALRRPLSRRVEKRRAAKRATKRR